MPVVDHSVLPLRSGAAAGDEPARADAIGDILRQTNQLSAAQVESVLKYQREKGLKFGEAAVALGFVSPHDVQWAVAQQFSYPYIRDDVSGRADLAIATDPFGEIAQFVRDLRSQLLAGVFSQAGGRTLAVVGTERGEGRTFLATNLAIAFAQLGGRVAMVDADMRHPRVHQVFGFDAGHEGLSTILAGRTDSMVVSPSPSFPNLHVLPAGLIPPNPLELVERPRWASLMRDLGSAFDFVVVDTPASTDGADNVVIASQCFATVAVARRDSASFSNCQSLLTRLRRTPSKIAGFVMNNF